MVVGGGAGDAAVEEKLKKKRAREATTKRSSGGFKVSFAERRKRGWGQTTKDAIRKGDSAERPRPGLGASGGQTGFRGSQSDPFGDFCRLIFSERGKF